MSHGIRVEDIAWQAFQAGIANSDVIDLSKVSDAKEAFVAWWKQRTEQGCALPNCWRCGYDPSPNKEPSSAAARIKTLSPRQLEIGKLIATGWDCHQIAKELEMKYSTVHTHRAALLKRAGCRNDVELARLFANLGIVGFGP